MQTGHVSALETKHQGLEKQIQQELSRPAPDMATVQLLKKQKLQIKEELYRN
ncbi:MAG: YdcH family protein [Caenibius sp.]